jgi:hypothetical protein
MHSTTASDHSDHTGDGPFIRYDSSGSDEYLSNLSSYSDNESDLGSDDCNNYESNYESDNEEAPCTSTSITETPLVQLPNVKERKANVTYTLRQEKFNDTFSSKDLVSAIREILSSPPRDMSNDKGSLECFPIYSFLFLNKKESSLYNIRKFKYH